jgi:membrane fusion protein, copper/silver efflux system
VSSMKRVLYAVFLLVIIAGTFWAGSRFSRREAVEPNRSDAKSSLVTTAQVPDNHTGANTETDTDTDTDVSSLPPGTVRIIHKRQQTIGLRVGTVEKKPLAHTLRILGRIAAEDTRIYRVIASVDAWIKDVRSNSVGSLVKKNEVLATFYNPQFLDAQQSYLFALGTVERLELGRKQLELGRKEAPAPPAFDPYTVQRQIDVLRGMGVADTQIEEIGRTRKISQNIRITAPADGFITARNVSPEQRFLKGTELYQIADLSRVWILADVYENEAQYLKPGIVAKVTLPYQKRIYHAEVTKVLPIFDRTTRTLKVRLETENPGYTLKPDMFVDVELPIALPPAIAVPADAILDSGLKKTVFVDRGNGFFEPREVETGWRLGNRVEVTKGLEPGERIVTSGTFLIDSESKLEMAAAGMQGTLSKDPVCGVEVSPKKAERTGRKISYRGKTYYFDSDECKQTFEEDPDRYAEKPAEEETSARHTTTPDATENGQGHDHP